MEKYLWMAGGLVAGAAVVGLGMLFIVPRSGAETRRLIQQRISDIKEEGQRAAEERRLELRAEYKSLTQMPRA